MSRVSRTPSSLAPGGPEAGWRNWTGNQRATAVEVVRPASAAEVADAVRAAVDAGRRIKPVGMGHSFSDIAHTTEVRLDTSALTGLVSIDRDTRLVTVQAGVSLLVLNEVLAGHGLAMPNLGDIDTQTIGGAISTGTHGTGRALGNLSTFVAGFTLVTAAGEVLRCTADTNPELFAAGRVGLGALGVLVDVTLQCVDAFTLLADERPLPLATVLAEIDTYVAENDHVDMFWFPYTEKAQVKRNNRVAADERPLSRWRGWLDDDFLANSVLGVVCGLGRTVPGLVRPINAIAARALAPRVYTARSDKVFCTPRRVRFTEMEYSVPRAALGEVFAAARRIVNALPFRVNFPIEVRFTAGDDIWLSHGYGRDSAYVAVQQYVGMPYEPYLREFEKVCAGLDGRPHWGKLHYRDAESLRGAYPRFDDFLALRDRLDPDRVFANAYTDRILGP